MTAAVPSDRSATAHAAVSSQYGRQAWTVSAGSEALSLGFGTRSIASTCKTQIKSTVFTAAHHVAGARARRGDMYSSLSAGPRLALQPCLTPVRPGTLTASCCLLARRMHTEYGTVWRAPLLP